LRNLSANGKQGLILEEIYQILLSNKKQGNLDSVQAANIIKQMQTRINREKYTFRITKSLEYLKYLKTGRFPYLGLEKIIHFLKSQIHLVRRSLLKEKVL
jgi:hypothetical protein